MCGKSVRGTLLCETCELEVLQKQKGKRFFISGLATIVLFSALYFLWVEYSEKKSQIETGIVTGAFDNFGATFIALLKSPFMFVPVVLILLFVAFIIGTKLSN
jgi:hypothetical protein